MSVLIRPMSMKDYIAVRDLWETCEGVGLSDADQPEPLSAYLVRNPEMSFVAQKDDAIVGAALCGHDGRRGVERVLVLAVPTESFPRCSSGLVRNARWPGSLCGER